MEKGQDMFALALLNELEVLKEENVNYQMKAKVLDKVSLKIQELSHEYTLDGIEYGSVKSFQNSSVQNALYTLQATIEKELAEFGNSQEA